MNPPLIGDTVNLLLAVFGAVGGVSGLIGIYIMAKERGAKDAQMNALKERVDKMESKQDGFEREVLHLVLDIKADVATIKGALKL